MATDAELAEIRRMAREHLAAGLADGSIPTWTPEQWQELYDWMEAEGIPLPPGVRPRREAEGGAGGDSRRRQRGFTPEA